jgi:serine/threonine protein phosphatase 1
MPRTIAIGDIHGCLAALDALLAAIRPGGEDTLVALGDYVDRGPDSRGTIERLLALQRQCRLVPLLGNHDEMLLLVHDGYPELFDDWLQFGGDATLASYGTRRAEDIPPEHIAFLQACRLWHETDRHFFVHGNYLADTWLDRQPRVTLLWESLKTRQPGPHRSGKTAIVGHTSQKNGEILDLGYLKCIDTCCYGQGWLTALDVDSGRVWQADKAGGIRD